MRVHSGSSKSCRFKKVIASRKRALAAAHRLSRELGERMQAYSVVIAMDGMLVTPSVTGHGNRDTWQR